jgi:hypothetical protein
MFEPPPDPVTWGRDITVATIETTGKGQPWSTKRAQGFWRTFAEMDLENDEAMTGFVARYGDPDCALSPKTPVHTYYWRRLQGLLKPFARAWEQPDPDGFSQFAASESNPAYFAELNEKHFKDVSVVPDPETGFALHFKNLGDYLIGSALEMARNKPLLHRCDYCGHWHEAARRSARYCSSTCRTQHKRK